MSESKTINYFDVTSSNSSKRSSDGDSECLKSIQQKKTCANVTVAENQVVVIVFVLVLNVFKMKEYQFKILQWVVGSNKNDIGSYIYFFFTGSGKYLVKITILIIN